MHSIDPTRTAALARLAEFVPRAGRSYAHERNTDYGRGQHRNVSKLSPYTRRRLLTEREIVEAVIARHGHQDADRFVTEVFWRSYFKGWLERRPGVWAHYTQSRDALLIGWQDDQRLADATGGRSGIAIFDDWARELIDTGYLHNHARMWFASIWIFTLRLPWQLGADFFLRHLLDGDPASNTLSWRWVAGLHTRGKHYLATRRNIEQFTRNRPPVEPGVLNETAEPLAEDFDYGLALPPRTPRAPDPARRSGLLLTIEDCCPESLSLPETVGTAILDIDRTTPRPPAPVIRAFDAAALDDTASRLGVGAGRVATIEGLLDWAQDAGISQIVTPYTPCGPVHDWLTAAAPLFATHDIAVAELRREWDNLVWDRATAGFFKVKKSIPAILSAINRY